ncbi:MAG: ABC transporter permease [Lachnospiraceae bacterium]|nr:ABC transporter permease [Lachnospiraceae bacterium]
MERIKELYAYREMLISLVRKDLRGRYKASVLGFLWTFINPLLQLIVYTIVFSVIMRAGIKDFYMFLFVALVPWIFFSSSLTGGATTIINNGDMVKKIYFPRLVLPMAYVTSCFVNMLFCFIVIFAVIIVTGFGVNFTALLCLPLIMIIEYILALGISFITSACTVYLRDLEHILGIATMAWMYLSPIMYPASFVPDKYQALFNLNPMTPVITAYRDILYYKTVPHFQTLLSSAIIGVVSVIVGYFVFEKLQKGFAEEM